MSQFDASFQKRIVSKEFSAEYYLRQLDSEEDIDDPILHYLTIGWLENRDPSPDFSTSFYLAEYPDVAGNGMNPFFHYIVAGRSEGRFAHARDPRKISHDLDHEMAVVYDSVDANFYVDQVSSLKGQSKAIVVRHFVEQGWRELLDPSAEFSSSEYLEANKDVVGQGVNPLFHYLTEGRYENRAAYPSALLNAETDASGRGSSSPLPVGALVAHLSPEVLQALSHPFYFDATYFREIWGVTGTVPDIIFNYLSQPMRAASPYFDPVWYAEQHPDVVAEGFAPLHHYIAVGRAKGYRPSEIFDGELIEIDLDRTIEIIKASGLFDPTWYAHTNADVVRANADPLKHYALVGHHEYKRTPNALFDNTFYLKQAPDVSERRWHPLVHYILLGSKKNLSTHPFFDIEYFNIVRPPNGTGQPALARLFDTAIPDGIGPNEFFDPSFYRRTLPEADQYPGGCVAHYMESGWKSGLDPSERFSTDAYVEANPDVRHSKTNPLYHFLVSGRLEGRDPKPKRLAVPATLDRFGDPEYGAWGPVLNFDLDTCMPRNFSHTVAVHLHLFYVEMLEEFCQYFRNIPVKFHLFVSVPAGRGDPDQIGAAFAKSIPNCLGVTVATPPNRGRDVAPFLVEFGNALLAFDLVLHLHSKRSPHSAKHAGWRRYLLHHTLGNRSIVTQILTAFHLDPDLGLMQPPYHPEVRAQPKWGNNREIVANLLRHLGLSFAGENCPHFPAGSFFWARVDALRPLLEGRLKLEQFDEEAGQIDATTAHGVERLFGIVPVLRGYSIGSRFIDVGYNLTNYYGKSRSYGGFDRDRTQDIFAYQRSVRSRNGKRARVAVVTAIVGRFDALLLPELLEPDVDYYCVSDDISDGYGVFRLLPCPYFDADPRRMARYIKTNLLRTFPGYDFVVWVDANVLIRGRVGDFVAATESSGCPVGGISHPIRATYLEEAKVAVAAGLDDGAVIEAQVSAYAGIDGLDQETLIETNFMVFDARNPKTREFQRLWWNEINKFSRRDQLSVNQCLVKTGIKWCSLLPEYMSTRDSEQFALFRHGINEWGPKPHIYSSWHEPNDLDGGLLPLPDVYRWSKNAGALDLDVVICVFNALDDVKQCLSSVEKALNGRGNIIIVDDCSDEETAQFLKTFTRGSGARLVRNDMRAGYTVAANAGVRAGSAKNVLLLNSDTIVPADSLDKLSDVLDRHEMLGIVGPLSNAASAQSVPSTANSGSQTAINPIPPGMTIAGMDLFFEKMWDGELVRTPLVHGFCFCVKRAVFDAIGMFDEGNFPRGYGEENDFCFRAVDAGFDLAVHTGTYIFHAKSKSYADDERALLMEEGMRALVRIHGRARISRSVATMNAEPGLVRVRDAAASLFSAEEVSSPGGRLMLAPALRSDGLPTGSAYVRVLLPYTSAKLVREWDVLQLRSTKLQDCGRGDVVLVQRDAGFLKTEEVESWIANVKSSGARLIYEIDDDLLDGHALGIRGFRGDVADLGYRVRSFAQAADCVTVSSHALVNKLSIFNPHTMYIPNSLDGHLWGLTGDEPPSLRDAYSRSRKGVIRIGYIGTPTHDDDLTLIREVVAELQAQFPGRIDFQVIGGFSDRAKAFGDVIQLPLANDYPSFVRWLRQHVRWDIGVAPLVGNSFNGNKSYLKYLECSALGMAMVCSDGPEYKRVVRHGETGLLVQNTKTAWSTALAQLVREPEQRVRLARNAFESVRADHRTDNVAERITAVLLGRQTEL